MRGRVLLEDSVDLPSGTEYHKRLTLRRGSVVTYTCTSSRLFYCGFFDRRSYIELRSVGGPGVFGFDFGTDRREFTREYAVPRSDDYYLVLRRGRFTSDAPVDFRVVYYSPGDLMRE